MLLSFVFIRAYGLWNVGNVFAFMLIGVIGAVVSQIGDLAASAFKRNADIKDFGVVIPGHGGVLDRFDSVIFTAPMIFFLVAIIYGL